MLNVFSVMQDIYMKVSIYPGCLSEKVRKKNETCKWNWKKNVIERNHIQLWYIIKYIFWKKFKLKKNSKDFKMKE